MTEQASPRQLQAAASDQMELGQLKNKTKENMFTICNLGTVR